MVRYGVLILGFLAAQQACADSELSSLAAAQSSNTSIPDKNTSYPDIILLLPSNTSDPESSMFLLADVLRQSPTFNDSDPDINDAEDENEAIVRKIMSFVAAIEGNATETTKASPDNSTALQESNMKKRDLEDSNSPLIRRKRTFKKKKGGCMVCGMLAPIMSMIPKKGGCGMMGCGQPAYYQPPPCGHPMSPCGRPPQPPPQPVYHVPQQTCNPCQRPRPPPPPPPQPCHTCQQGYSGGYPGGMSYSSSSSSSQSSSYGWAKK
ncbi:uncharacterized protein LOC124362344 [Homalodisca vitripennis]|uniref:uncharacterized protein LOC124362344 n=1 Tax=Homalodisca vitripennis TaxID=197043 RepID=UPI001EECF2F5|nr:uncharacterized protein LOC124362344 [Homalodisca vitripennis]